MNQSAANGSSWIVETTSETFETDVIERSKQLPVVVDFWATWCGPCRLLGPLLEQLAAERQGQFVLVKADTDQLPKEAAEFQVQSIPAVFAVVGGEVVDFFVGVLPAEQLAAWLDRVLRAAQLAEAQKLEETTPAAAEATYRAVLAEHPHEAACHIGLARVLLAQDRDEECAAVIQELEKRGFLEPEAEDVRAALELRSKKTGDVDARRAAFAADPDNLQLQLELAEALAGEQRYAESLDACLELVEKDKNGVGEKARQIMVDIFRVLPDDSELVRTYRRKLSAALY